MLRVWTLEQLAQANFLTTEPWPRQAAPESHSPHLQSDVDDGAPINQVLIKYINITKMPTTISKHGPTNWRAVRDQSPDTHTQYILEQYFKIP